MDLTHACRECGREFEHPARLIDHATITGHARFGPDYDPTDGGRLVFTDLDNSDASREDV